MHSPRFPGVAQRAPGDNRGGSGRRLDGKAAIPKSAIPRWACSLQQIAKLLVHLATGPENATRAALALLVAKTAADEGHDVRVFLAGDAVQLARRETAEATTGVGTGNVHEHLTALRQAEVPIYLSGMSSQARGVEPDASEGAELAPPQKLVELALDADRTLTY